MGLQCPCSNGEKCWKNGGIDEQCTSDYSLEVIFAKIQDCFNGKVIIPIFAELVSDVRAIIVGYVPDKACFCKIAIKHDETIKIMINFYGQFSSTVLTQNCSVQKLFETLPGNEGGGGNYNNEHMPLKRDVGYFNKTHRISKSDYIFSDINLRDMCQCMIQQTDEFLSEFIRKTYTKLATQFRCQHVSMSFLLSCKCNGLSSEYCKDKNTEMAEKMPSGMFSDKTKLFVGPVA